MGLGVLALVVLPAMAGAEPSATDKDEAAALYASTTRQTGMSPLDQ